MSVVGEVSAVFGLITGSIALIEKSIKIYSAVQDKDGLEPKLRKVADKLPQVEELLQTAEAQYHDGAPEEAAWIRAQETLQRCKNNCQAIHDIFSAIFPQADASSTKRLWKGALTHFGGRGKKVDSLFTDMYEQLDTLVQNRILTNTGLLEGIKATVDELADTGNGNFENSGSGAQQNLVQHGQGTMNATNAVSKDNARTIQIPGGTYTENSQGTQDHGVGRHQSSFVGEGSCEAKPHSR